MKREIRISNAMKRALMAEFGTTQKTVWLALHNMDVSSELLENIRKAALERGGQVYIVAPEEEVLVDTGDKLVQRLGKDVRLECDKATGNAYIYKGSELLSTHHAVVSPLASIQEFGKTL